MTAGIYRAWTRGQRRKEFRRLGNELAQLKRSGHASAGTMRACIREEILVLTQASLDMCDGLPPRLVEDLMQADNAPFTRVNAPGIVSFFAPPDDDGEARVVFNPIAVTRKFYRSRKKGSLVAAGQELVKRCHEILGVSRRP